MKKIILTTVLLVSATASADSVYLENTNVFDLNDERPSVDLMVAYPGKKMSGLCAIEIRSDRYTARPLIQLLEKVSLNYVFSDKAKPIESVSHNVLRVRLMPGAYLDGFEISARDGSPLRKAIADALGGKDGERSVVAVARTCP